MNVQPPHKSIADSEWRILLIDGDEDDFILIRDMLKEAKGRRINLNWASTYERGQTKLAEDHYDAVLVDNDLGARTGIDLIRTANQRGATSHGATTPLVLFTGRGSYEVDIEAMQAGATVYLSKNELSALSLERFIRYAIERKQAEVSLRASEANLRESEAKYRTFFENVRGNIMLFEVVFDEQGQVIDLICRDANPPVLALLGTDSSHILNQKVSTLFPAEILEQAFLNIPHVLRTGELWNDEQSFNGHDFLYSIFRMNDHMLAASALDITERKRVEAALEASERKSRELIQYAPTAIYEIDFRTQRFTAVNDAMVVMSGYSREELLQMSAYDLVEEQGRALLDERMRQWQLSQPPTKNAEYRIKTKDGRLVDAVINITVNLDEHGRPISGTVIAHDITERKRAEKALLESEQKYRTLFENSPEAIFITRPDGSVQSANPAACAMFGWSEEELIRLGRSGILDIKDPRLASAFEERQRTGSFEAREYTGIRKGGEHFPVEVDSVILPGEPRRSFVILRDITERKRAEDALRESQERFRVLFHNRHSPMLLIDPETGQIIDANPAASAYYGWSQEEMTRMKISDINTLPADQIHQAIHEVEAIATGKRFAFRHRLSNGEVRDVEVNTGPIKIGQKEYLFSIIHDVTERRQVQEALRKSEEKFAKAFRSSPIALAISTVEEGRFIEINDSYADLYGYSREEIIGHTSLELNILLPEDREKIIEKFRRGRGFRDIELHGRAKSGEIRDTLFSTEPIEIDGKEYMLSVINNITERKQAEAALRANAEALRESEERERHRAHELAAILDAVPAYIFITHDPDSRTMTANRATQELLRSRPGDNISKSAPEPEIPRQFRAMRNGKEIPNDELPVQLAAAKRIHVEDYEFDVVFEDGGSRRLMGNAAPLYDEHSNPAGAVGAFIDITELRRIEQETSERIAQMEIQRRLLEHREMERSQIARDLHDGPIQSLVGLSFSLQMLQSTINQEARDMIKQMKQDVGDLVGELRGVCNELRPPLLERFGFRKAVEAHVEGFREKHPEIWLDLDITENPDKLPGNIATALFRIYQEALNNVIRHSEATEISIQFSFDHQRILLEIHDNGKGLPLNVDWVELVRQGHFGLVGMKERAEAIGGELKINSSSGKGTTIRVTVPTSNN